MFWKKKKAQAADAAMRQVTDLTEKVLTIGPTGVLLLLGGAAAAGAATYLIARTRKNRAREKPQDTPNEKAAD